MNLKQLITDDDAVSPVIGVILMVAITVILAAVIASFVLGLGDQAGEAAPQVSVECDFGASPSEMVHSGGNSIEDASVTVDGGSEQTGNAPYEAGDVIANSITEDGTQLIWEDSDGGSTQIIAEC